MPYYETFIIDMTRIVNRQLEDNEEVKKHYENLNSFIMSLKDQNKKLDTLDAWDQAILNDLKNKMIASLNTYQIDNEEKGQNKKVKH